MYVKLLATQEFFILFSNNKKYEINLMSISTYTRSLQEGCNLRCYMKLYLWETNRFIPTRSNFIDVVKYIIDNALRRVIRLLVMQARKIRFY